MASNLEIPGLGHLDSNSTSSTSVSQPQNAVTEMNALPKIDTVMSDADNETKYDGGTIVGENNSSAKITEPAVNGDDVPLALDAAGLEPAEDEKMQDVHTLQAPVTNDTSTSENTHGIYNPEINTSNGVETQEPADAKASPPSPRVTDALEAALDGLLGPAPTPSAVENGIQNDSNTEDQEEKVRDQTGDLAQASGEGDNNPEWEVDSSPYESSSSDSSDDSSDEESDVEESKLGVEETARLLMEADGGSDDEMDGTRAAKQAAAVRTKNEQPDEPEARPDIVIDPEDSVVPLGIVQHIVEGTQAVIEALRDGSAVTVLDRGSVLCKEDRTVLGVIHDTIATVHKPMYVLKFKNEEEAKGAGLQRGMQVWYPKAHAVFVFPSQLRMEKGSDASNLHDEEVGPDEIEYSDDEQEQAYKREKKNRKRGGKSKFNKGDEGESRGGPAMRKEANNLQYDEDDDGPYRPLQRPANFGMGLPPAPPPAMSGYSSAINGSRGGHHNGAWRGDSGRGRGGGRGRGYNGRGRGAHYSGGHSSSTPQQQPQQSNHQPPPPFSANPPPALGQWPFPIPPMPQFTGAAPNASAPNPAYPSPPRWGTAQPPNPFAFPIIPPPGWPNAAPQHQQANYGGYSASPPPAQYPPPANNSGSTPTPSNNNYQYPGGYYNGGQAPNGQSQQQHWG